MIDSFYIYIIPVLFLVIGYLVGIMLSKNKIKSESDKIIKLETTLENLKETHTNEIENRNRDNEQFQKDLITAAKDGAGKTVKPLVDEMISKAATLGEAHKSVIEQGKGVSSLQEQFTRTIHETNLKKTYSNVVRGLNGEEQLRDICKKLDLKIPEQVQFNRNQDGNDGTPDVIFHLPVDQQKIICDVKTPLLPFEEFFDAAKNADEEKMLSLKSEVTEAITGHIKKLSKRKYNSIKGSYPYVIMFLPSQDYLDIAREGYQERQEDLDHFALKNNIILSSPISFWHEFRNIKNLWISERNYRVNKQSLDFVKEAFDKIRVVYDKADEHARHLSLTMKSGQSLNTSIFTTLGKAVEKADEIEFKDENIEKIKEAKKSIDKREI